MFYLTIIEECSEGFGEYQFSGDCGDGVGLKSELFEDYTNQGMEIYELGKDDLPESVEDIRGSIRCENELCGVYVWVDENGNHGYLGVFELDEEE